MAVSTWMFFICLSTWFLLSNVYCIIVYVSFQLRNYVWDSIVCSCERNSLFLLLYFRSSPSLILFASTDEFVQSFFRYHFILVLRMLSYVDMFLGYRSFLLCF